MQIKRVFLVVLDSFGIGEAPDASDFGDESANTLASIAVSRQFDCPNLTELGLFNLDGVECRVPSAAPIGSYARLRELSRGKDTIIGHWELAGLVSSQPMPTFPEGFPESFILEFEQATGRKCICNRPYSGTQVIADYGMEHLKTGALIVYTSADSVFQIAANESVVPIEELYRVCRIAREMLTGGLAVGRVIARPFEGDSPENFKRTARRHDFALSPFAPTMLDVLKEAGKDVIAVGKINDIFNGQGITETYHTVGNEDGMQRMSRIAKQDFNGLCFVNLVDFDMLYGHRRDVDGYAAAAADFDQFLSRFMPVMREDDLLMVTADHGCDPAFQKTTDHTREYVPLLLYGRSIHGGENLGTRDGFTCVSKLVCDALGVKAPFQGDNLWSLIK